MVDEVSKTGWWDRHTRDVSNWVIDAVWLEDRAERLQVFSIATVSGLLRTAGYAEALIRVGSPDAPKQQLRRWVDLRRKRQEILERRDELTLTVVLDEAALHRPIGGRDVMANQMTNLVTRAQESNIGIRILPFAAGEHCGAAGSFTMIGLPEPFPVVGYVETPAGALYAEATAAEELAGRYARLWETSLNEDESIDFLTALAGEWS